MLRFWFHFVYPHTSRIAQAGPARARSQIVQPGLDAYFGRCFGTLCREALPVLYEKEGVTADFRIGSYWDKSVQIDVVGLRGDGWIDLGECKWGTAVSAASAARQLEEKVHRYRNPRQATIGRRLFVRSFERKSRSVAANLRVHTLEDLYS